MLFKDLFTTVGKRNVKCDITIEEDASFHRFRFSSRRMSLISLQLPIDANTFSFKHYKFTTKYLFEKKSLFNKYQLHSTKESINFVTLGFYFTNLIINALK